MKITDNINLAQKKIITAVLVWLCVFLVSWMFVYLPARRQVMRMKQQLNAAEEQIRGIEGGLEGNVAIEAGMKLLQEKSGALAAKFPQREEESLRMLSALAQKLNLEIVSLLPEPKTLFLKGQDNLKTEVEGRTCYTVAVAIEMRGSYNDLLRYIAALEESPEAHICVEGLKITKGTAGPAKLNINLNLKLYLLS
jgi:hypothetical protein